MKTDSFIIKSRLILLLLAPALTSCAGNNGVPDPHLVGQWHGQDAFHGMNRQEIVSKKVIKQPVDTLMIIATNGLVTGHIGGASLTNCVVVRNRGWLGRKLHLATDFVISGQLVGPVTPGSAGGTHNLSAPFNLVNGQISGTVFVLHTFTYPYPFLGLRLDP